MVRVPEGSLNWEVLRLAKIWHVFISGKQHGPLSNSELKSLAGTGKLTPTDKIWKEGLQDWIPAGKIKGLFPPTPPPLPQCSAPNQRPSEPNLPSFIWPEPALGEVVIPDDDASEAWKNRDSPIRRAVGILKGFSRKTIQEVVVNYRHRVFRHYEDGREIFKDDVLDRLENGYANRGFKVRRFTSSLMVTKQGSGSGSKSDSSADALSDVSRQLNGFIRVSESNDSWVVSLKGEIFFWPEAMQQLMGAASFAFIALIFFWPCLCLIPFAFNFDPDQAKAVLQEDLKTPIEKLSIEFV